MGIDLQNNIHFQHRIYTNWQREEHQDFQESIHARQDDEINNISKRLVPTIISEVNGKYLLFIYDFGHLAIEVHSWE